MKRRSFFRNLTLGSAIVAVEGSAAIASPKNAILPHKGKVALKIAYITDVHIMTEAKDKFKNCLEEIKKQHKPDFYLNGGDAVYAVDSKNINREKVFELWDAWDDCKKVIDKSEMYSCLGNHDMWWAAPDKEDEMYGKNYAVKRLGIPNRYYSFSKGGWHFIVLDGNSDVGTITMDADQFNWLKKELEGLSPNTPVLIMSHFPILCVTAMWAQYNYPNFMEFRKLFYTHKDKVKMYLSGHSHLLEKMEYNGVTYLGSGAVSGSWWRDLGRSSSVKPGYVQETPPGYAILTLYDNGEVDSTYHAHEFLT